MKTVLCLLALFGSDVPDAEGTAAVPTQSVGTRESRVGAREAANRAATVIIVVGAEGTAEYGREFASWAEKWETAAKAARAETIGIGRKTQDTPGNLTDRAQLQEALSHNKTAASEMWLVFIGHGTFDGREAKFNLRGPDVSAGELKQWLSEITAPLAVINCASSSAPFVNELSQEGRVIVTATKSGFEQNFSRFGKSLSDAIADTSADLDKDGQTSLLEAFLMASRRTDEFYKTEGRLPTEHAQLDDNGDQQGTRADAFRGIRPVKAAAGGKSADGYRAHQWHLVRSTAERQFPVELRQQRDELELAVIQLRDRKDQIDENAYYAKLESLLVQFATLYEQAERGGETTGSSSPIRLAGFNEPAPPPMPTDSSGDEVSGNDEEE